MCRDGGRGYSGGMNRFDAIVLGAGLCGLTAARELHRTGHTVALLDKGRGVGGRVATRRADGVVFNHGCQFFTGTEPRFVALIREWLDAGCATEWCRGFGTIDGHVRYRGEPAMTAIAKHLASGLDVRLQETVTAVEPGWRVVCASGQVFEADNLVLTAPVPQSLALLDVGKVELPGRVRRELETIHYDRCLTVMAVTEGETKVPSPGALVFDTEPVAWIADNAIDGVGSRRAVVIHAGPDFSLSNWDRDRMEVGRELLAVAAPWIGDRVASYLVHGWKYANPQTPHSDSCVAVEGREGLLVFAGDGFGVGLLEGAVMSGFAAAGKIEMHSTA